MEVSSLSSFFSKESLFYPFAILLVYYVLIFIEGPRFMKNRNAFALRNVLLIYNTAQIILNAHLLLLSLKTVTHFNITCTPPSTSDSPEDAQVRYLHFYYLLIKYVDLLDTIFFVLRKKKNQITFLHVYHHTGIIVITSIPFKHMPGGPHLYLTIYNTTTHVIMYGYYLLSAWDSSKFFWCRKYITQTQFVQHALVFTTFSVQLLNPNCGFPKIWLFFCDLNGMFMVYLFIRFYKQQYEKNKKNKTATNDTVKEN